MNFPKIGRDSSQDHDCENVLLNHLYELKNIEHMSEGNSKLLEACATRITLNYIPNMGVPDELKETLDDDMRYVLYYLNLVIYQTNLAQKYLERAIDRLVIFENHIDTDKVGIEDVDSFLLDIMPKEYEKLDKKGEL